MPSIALLTVRYLSLWKMCWWPLVSEQEVLDTLNLTGRRAEYQLAIPKGDPHIWEGQRVQFFGETWRVIGNAIRGIEALIPLEWNQKVTVESCCGKVEN